MQLSVWQVFGVFTLPYILKENTTQKTRGETFNQIFNRISVSYEKINKKATASWHLSISFHDYLWSRQSLYFTRFLKPSVQTSLTWRDVSTLICSQSKDKLRAFIYTVYIYFLFVMVTICIVTQLMITGVNSMTSSSELN